MTASLRQLRVGYLGREPSRWLGTRVNSYSLDLRWVPSTDADDWVDVIVLDANSADADSISLIQDARAAGIKTVLFGQAQTNPDAAQAADLVVTPSFESETEADLRVLPLVDLSQVSPEGSLTVPSNCELDAIQTSPRRLRRGSMRFFERMIEEEQQTPGVSRADVHIRRVQTMDDIRRLLPHLKKSCGVIDHGSLHASLPERLNALAELSVAGVPVAFLDSQEKATTSPEIEALRDAATSTLSALLDTDERHRLSVAQRRVGLNLFTDWHRWMSIDRALGLQLVRLPTVSVLLATKRPHRLAHALEQLDRQTYAAIEPVLMLHGDGFSEDAVNAFRARFSGTKVLREPDELPFGTVLNRGLHAATGPLVTKMDDDDWYGRHHIHDLVYAMEYSGAALVGKAPEWVYIAEMDITVRRFVRGAEWGGTVTLAGGTLMMYRDELISIGGFRNAHRHVDLGLIQDVHRLSGTRYRTHGFEYVLNREATGHTWEVDVDYFLEQSETQLRGLSLRAAGWSPSEAKELVE